MNTKCCPACGGKGRRGRIDAVLISIHALQRCRQCAGSGRVVVDRDALIWDRIAGLILSGVRLNLKSFSPRVIRNMSGTGQGE